MEKIVNINEQIFREKLAAKLEAPDNTEYCACQSCQNDMMTFALNKMAVNYVTTEGGEVIKRQEMKRQKIDFDAAVEEAIKVVGKAPRHEEDNHINFVNISEVHVKERIEPILRADGGCTCMKCYNDILCLACNSLPPHYVNSVDGDLYQRIEAYDKSFKEEIDEAIFDAIKIVRINPRH